MICLRFIWLTTYDGGGTKSTIRFESYANIFEIHVSKEMSGDAGLNFLVSLQDEDTEDDAFEALGTLCQLSFKQNR